MLLSFYMHKPIIIITQNRPRPMAIEFPCYVLDNGGGDTYILSCVCVCVSVNVGSKKRPKRTYSLNK